MAPVSFFPFGVPQFQLQELRPYGGPSRGTAIGQSPLNGVSGEPFIHNTAATSNTAVLANVPTTGQTLLLLASTGVNTQNLTALSQGGVRWYRLGMSQTTLTAEAWIGIVDPDGTSALSATINLTSLVNGSVANIRYNVSVWNGTPIVRVISGASTSAIATTAVTGAALAHPSDGSDVLIVTSARSQNGGLSAPGGGFTALTSGSTGYGFAYQRVGATTGSYQPTWTQTSGTFETFSVVLAAATPAQQAAWSAVQQFISANGTDSAFPAVYHEALNTVVASAAVSAWDDARLFRGATTGPQLAQATGANQPALSGAWGSGAERITLSSASSQHLLSAATSALQLSPNASLYEFVVYESTGTGPIAYAAADPTNAAVYPYIGIQAAGSNHKGDFAGEGVTTGRIQPDSGVAFADGKTRIAGIGHAGNVSGNSASDVTYQHFFAGRQISTHHGVTAATAGNLKIAVGRIGSTYGNGKPRFILYTTQQPTRAFWMNFIAFAQAQFGAEADTAKRNTILWAGDSLDYGSQSTDPMLPAIGTGTTSPPYVAAHQVSGSRGSLVTQGADVDDIHHYNYGVSGRTLRVIVDTFEVEIAPNFDGTRPGPGIVIARGIGNHIQNFTADATNVRAVLVELRDKVHAVGGKLYVETEIDRGAGNNGSNANATGWYLSGPTSGAGLSANGTTAATINTDLRTNDGSYSDGYIEQEADGSTRMVINRATSLACNDTTYFAVDKVHGKDPLYSLMGGNTKNYLDANDTVLWDATGAASALPGVGALAFSGFAPSVTLSDNQSVAAGVAALAIAGFAPTAAVSNNQSVGAGVAALSLAGFAPTVVIGFRSLADVGSLTLAGFAPTAAVSNNQAALAAVGALTLTGFAPTAVVGVRALAGLGALSLAGFSPSISVSDNKAIAAGIGAVSLAGFAPVVTASDAKTAAPGVGALSLSGFAPTATSSNQTGASPGVGSVALAGLSPSVQVSNHQIVAAGVGSLAFAGFAPTVAADARNVLAGAASLLFAGFPPTVSAPNAQTVLPGSGALALAGFAPTVSAAGSQTIATLTASLVLAGYAPSATVAGAEMALEGRLAVGPRLGGHVTGNGRLAGRAGATSALGGSTRADPRLAGRLRVFPD